MQFRLRAPVLSADDTHVGHVRYLLIESPGLQLAHIVVGGRRSTRIERQVSLQHVTSRGSEQDALMLDLTSDEVEELPDFVDVESARERDSASRFQPPRVTGFGDLSAPLVQQRETLDSTPSPTESVRNSAREVPLSPRTEIVSTTSNRSLGHLFSVECDEEGRLVALIGRQRLFRTHQSRIPVDWIVAISARHVQVSDAEERVDDASSEEEIEQESLPHSEIRPGMLVRCSNGTRVGEITGVDRSDDRVRAITVAHGLFGRLRKRLVVDVVDNVTSNEVKLTLERAEFKRLPDLER